MSIKYSSLFKRKSFDFLMHEINIKRLRAYHRSLQEKISKEQPWCCERQCSLVWESVRHKQWWETEHSYVMFVKAILLTRLTNEQY